MNARSVDLGKTGESAAHWFLSSIGAKNIHKLATNKIMVKKKMIHTKGTPCDFICSIPLQVTSGTTWLPSFIEVKLHDEDKLYHSRLSDDQVNALLKWHECNHWSFVLWVHKQECLMFKYPTILFKNGTSIDLTTAKKISWKNSSFKC